MTTNVQSLECPHCHETAVSPLRKIFLGPGRSVACRACGGKVSVPLSGMWVIIPIVVAVFLASGIKSSVVSYAVVIVGVAVSCFLHYRYLPLIAK
jgi:hypothetical protein